MPRNFTLLYMRASCLLALLLPAAAFGQQVAGPQSDSPARPLEATRRSLLAMRVAGAAPSIDGRLDEDVWGNAPAATDFVQFEPLSGAEPSERTEVRVLYDDEAIYFGVRLFDSQPDSIAAQLTRRDEDSFSDWIHVALDSYFDRRTAFAFGLNPLGVKQDVFVYNDTNEDEDWDAVWDGAAHIDSLGWTAEFRIPLSQLRFNAAARASVEQVWGVNFKRHIARRDEDDFWAPIERNGSRLVSLFGDLGGLRGLAPRRRLEVLPYTVGRLTRAPGDGANPYYRATDIAGTLGADVKYGVTSDMTLTVTLNPDFGQVEADPSQVNLSAFESFFSEKRPFFLEGTDIFRFGIGLGDGAFGNEQLFYSRRIGRAPQGEAPETAEFVDAPEATTILGAAKLSGKTASGWSIGLLEALTVTERALFLGEDGRRGSIEIEPRTNYTVARIARDFREGRSALGLIATSTNRSDEPAMRFLHSDAFTGGIDGRHRFGAGARYELSGWLLGSYVRGTAEAIERTQTSSRRYFQRPDADHTSLDVTRTSLSGLAGSLLFMKSGGGDWNWGVSTNVRSPGFEANDVGFQRSADQALLITFGGYNRSKPGKVFRNWRINFNNWNGWTLGGERTDLGANVNGSFQLLNQWSGWGGIEHNVSNLSVSALRGGPALRTPARTNTWAGFETDPRKSVQFELRLSAGLEHEGDGQWFGMGPEVEWRPSSRVELSLEPEVEWNTAGWQYITTETAAGTDHFVHATMRQTTTSLTARIDYTFTPTLSLQLYAQPFMSAGRFDGFMEARTPRASSFAERFHRYTEDELAPVIGPEGEVVYNADLDRNGLPDFSFDNPDFNFKELRSNAVLRWEYRPGSTLFLVWSQGRTAEDDYGRFRFRRDVGNLFGARATNVFLVKVSHWLGF